MGYSENVNDLSNDYFKTLLDMSVQWQPNGTGNSYMALDRQTGEKVRTASGQILVFESNSQLRALVEVYAAMTVLKNSNLISWVHGIK